MTNEQKFKETVFFIEATSFERHSLWNQYHEETNWVQDNSGVLSRIGEHMGSPVTVYFSFAHIYGKRICFYEATSNVVNHTMVKDYIKDNYPLEYDGGRIAITDAVNFGHAINFCRPIDISDSGEYGIIKDYYGDKTAERSGIKYINHIDEALEIFHLIGASEDAMKAFCIHPLLQPDEGLEKNWIEVGDEVDGRIILLAMEYRFIANSYLSQREIKDISEIRLSPLKDVNDMLIADKIQNKKDFMAHHYGKHERSEQLLIYFNNWLQALKAEDYYEEYVNDKH